MASEAMFSYLYPSSTVPVPSTIHGWRTMNGFPLRPERERIVNDSPSCSRPIASTLWALFLSVVTVRPTPLPHNGGVTRIDLSRSLNRTGIA